MSTATAEQRVAIERLRKVAAARTEIPNAAERFEEYRRIYAIPYAEDNSILNAIDSDQETVADLYLAERPDDDAEPVTKEWLAGIGFHTGGGAYWIRGDGPQIAIRYYEDATGGHFVESIFGGTPVLIVGGDAVNWNETRGEIRRLCTALGIELTPTS